MPASIADAVARLQRWLIAEGLAGAGEERLLRGLCERLLEAGVPLQRAIMGFDTLHPVVQGRVTTWVRSTGQIRRNEYTRFDGTEADWLASPFHALERSGALFLRRRLAFDYQDGEFPVLDRLRHEGLTDYLAARIAFTDPEPFGQADSVYSSWATERPTGFADAEVAILEAVLPLAALVVKASSAAWIARTLMETYLGRDAGRRVLQGDIERGVTRTIRAIIWFSDLRGFTRIADSAPREQLVPLLNDYAECLASAIHAHGGQVLKFMGDGLLAMFELADDGVACSRALDAAGHALAAVADINRRRAANGLPTTGWGLALHVGDVLYGNIGSLDRLDFTVVGPAVNEAARIEALCGSLEQAVIVSSAFVEAGPECRARLVSLGRYALRGVARPQELFTLDPEAPFGSAPDR